MTAPAERWIFSIILSAAVLNLCIKGEVKNQGDTPSDTVFVVLSQENVFHTSIADDFRTRFDAQVSTWLPEEHPPLLFTHEDFADVKGTWTVFPLIELLIEFHKEHTFSWVFFCEADTEVYVKNIIDFLHQHNATQEHFFGRALRDKHASIIHHFAFFKDPSSFAYPDFSAGFALSIGLLERLHSRLLKKTRPHDFSIDPKHELALFAWNKGKGTNLTNFDKICPSHMTSMSDCLTRLPPRFPTCQGYVDNSDLFVAVKTCKQFHSSRVQVVKNTWGKETDNIEYYSEEEDPSIPSVNIGVPNTIRGHCGKTMAIIRRVVSSKSVSQIPWVLIADDDTIINLARLRQLLACYNQEQPVALGERYGYGVSNGHGYDYITGGGGMVFNQPALKLLSEHCKCSSDDAPDDMTLGLCLSSLKIPATHSRHFHQARPNDYSEDFLANQLPVSFHKHWENDPHKVYADLMKTVDPVASQKETKTSTHDRQEL